MIRLITVLQFFTIDNCIDSLYICPCISKICTWMQRVLTWPLENVYPPKRARFELNRSCRCWKSERHHRTTGNRFTVNKENDRMQNQRRGSHSGDVIPALGAGIHESSHMFRPAAQLGIDWEIHRKLVNLPMGSPNSPIYASWNSDPPFLLIYKCLGFDPCRGKEGCNPFRYGWYEKRQEITIRLSTTV